MDGGYAVVTLTLMPPREGAKVPPISLAARIGDLLFVSGTPGFEEDWTLSPDFARQFERTMLALHDILARAGCTLRDVAKVNVLLTRATDVAAMNRLYEAAFGPPPFPARTTAVVAALPDPAMLIEIECVAALPPSGGPSHGGRPSR